MSGIRLYDYQLDAVKKMKNGCVLCGSVGSGKSRTALAYYYILHGGQVNKKDYVIMKQARDLYIITTARKRDTLEWDEELAWFRLSKNPEGNFYENKVVIDSWNNIGKYKEVKDAFFIFDEQRVVGKGAWVKSFIHITQTNKWILLSATPGDTWSDYVPIFIANGFYKNRTQFNREHIIFSRYTKYPKVDRYVNTRKLVRLRDRILIDMDYHNPSKQHHEDVICEYDKDLYKKIQKERWNEYKNQPLINAGELCYALRRVVNEDGNRSESVREIFRKHSKLIIFYNFDYERDILLNINFGEDVQVAEWSGHAHQEIPNSEKWVYLVQYTAGCEGWNCIKTNAVVFYSQNYSYKVVTQACGRIDRLNTPFTDLYYYHLRSFAPIDIAIKKALKEKRIFNERKFIEG